MTANDYWQAWGNSGGWWFGLIILLVGVFLCWLSSRYQLTELMDHHDEAPWFYLLIGLCFVFIGGGIAAAYGSYIIRLLVLAWLVTQGKLGFAQ